MIVGLILSGMILGLGSALVGFMGGLSFWAALMVYVGIGSFWVLAGTGIMAVRSVLGTQNMRPQQS
ncbi:MAG: hypothetical protein WBC93_04875 [Sulfitobacter sp.]